MIRPLVFSAFVHDVPEFGELFVRFFSFVLYVVSHDPSEPEPSKPEPSKLELLELEPLEPESHHAMAATPPKLCVSLPGRLRNSANFKTF
jgi:hypothetical protein